MDRQRPPVVRHVGVPADQRLRDDDGPDQVLLGVPGLPAVPQEDGEVPADGRMEVLILDEGGEIVRQPAGQVAGPEQQGLRLLRAAEQRDQVGPLVQVVDQVGAEVSSRSPSFLPHSLGWHSIQRSSSITNAPPAESGTGIFTPTELPASVCSRARGFLGSPGRLPPSTRRRRSSVR